MNKNLVAKELLKLAKNLIGSKNMIQEALDYIHTKHHGQFRKVSKLPYVSHPIAVSDIVAKYGNSKDTELIVAALLHDTLEDTNATYKELAHKFSERVASLVFELTNDNEAIEEKGKLEYHKEKLEKMSDHALVIKLADRLHNVLDNPTQKMLDDTLELLEHLKKSRKLTTEQSKLTEKIISICKK